MSEPIGLRAGATPGYPLGLAGSDRRASRATEGGAATQIAAAARSAEVVGCVCPAIGARDDVVCLGGGSAAHLAEVAVTGEDEGAERAPCARRAVAGVAEGGTLVGRAP